MPITLNDLRRFTVARNLPQPTTLKRALDRMGFVQADPIRAPARAQDLILRQRVKNYRAGDLEHHYAGLGVDEDVFINYGFVTNALQALMHPRSKTGPNGKREKVKTELLLEFVRERGAAHPRDVDERFSHGSVTNYWGGSSNATTRLLEDMHYRGSLRVARREKGIRVYAACQPKPGPLNAAERLARIDALVDVVVRIYGPLSGPSLSYYVRRLRYAVPQWQKELTNALQRAKGRLASARVNEADWYWSADENLMSRGGATAADRQDEIDDTVRLLAPFDPLVHDRARFELLWGWAYRFEAYTPLSKRKLGYYALPMLWQGQVIGWANLSVKNGVLESEFGYATSQPRERAFKRELETELDRMRAFLGLKS